jgi:hypothetical protein
VAIIALLVISGGSPGKITQTKYAQTSLAIRDTANSANACQSRKMRVDMVWNLRPALKRKSCVCQKGLQVAAKTRSNIGDSGKRRYDRPRLEAT